MGQPHTKPKSLQGNIQELSAPRLNSGRLVVLRVSALFKSLSRGLAYARKPERKMKRRLTSEEEIAILRKFARNTVATPVKNAPALPLQLKRIKFEDTKRGFARVGP